MFAQYISLNARKEQSIGWLTQPNLMNRQANEFKEQREAHKPFPLFR